MRTAKHNELRELVAEALKAVEEGALMSPSLASAITKLRAHMGEDYYAQKPTDADVEQVLESCINSVLFDPKDLVKRIGRWHRTLQQSFTSLCLCWLAHIAGHTDWQYDARNAAGVQTAKRIKAFCDENDIYLGELPTV